MSYIDLRFELADAFTADKTPNKKQLQEERVCSGLRLKRNAFHCGLEGTRLAGHIVPVVWK